MPFSELHSTHAAHRHVFRQKQPRTYMFIKKSKTHTRVSRPCSQHLVHYGVRRPLMALAGDSIKKVTLLLALRSHLLLLGSRVPSLVLPSPLGLLLTWESRNCSLL